MSRYTEPTFCKDDGCEKWYFPDRWGATEASRLGWFIQRNGDAWCPDHIPDWVAEWRAKRRAKKEK